MKTIQLSGASRPLAEYARQLMDEILVINDAARGPVAAVVPLRAVDLESLTLSAHPEFLDLIGGSRAEFATGRTLTLRQMKEAALPRQGARKVSRRTPHKPRSGPR